MIAIPAFWQRNFWAGVRNAHCLDVKTASASTLRIAYEMEPGVVRVPGKATFGGWWPLSGPVPALKDYSVAHAEFDRALGVGFSLSLTLPPEYFYPEIFGPQRELFGLLGYHLVKETNQTVPLAETGQLQLSKGNLKKIRQFSSVGSVARAAPGEFADCFELLLANRSRRGVSLSMSRNEFVANLSERPELYQCWKAEISGRIVGAAYTVEISDHATYVLYWGDSLEGRRYSVVASLFHEIWNNAVAAGKEFLDLGKSSVDGVLDEGLARFKYNLSAQGFTQEVWNSDRESSTDRLIELD